MSHLTSHIPYSILHAKSSVPRSTFHVQPRPLTLIIMLSAIKMIHLTHIAAVTRSFMRSILPFSRSIHSFILSSCYLLISSFFYPIILSFFSSFPLAKRDHQVLTHVLTKRRLAIAALRRTARPTSRALSRLPRSLTLQKKTHQILIARRNDVHPPYPCSSHRPASASPGGAPYPQTVASNMCASSRGTAGSCVSASGRPHRR